MRRIFARATQLPCRRDLAQCAATRWCAAFSTTHVTAKQQLPPRPTVREEDIEEKFLRGSGPGGQKINKTSSAVQLQHIPTGAVVKCQATRSRQQNRGLARRLLAEKLDELEHGADSRENIKGRKKQAKVASARKKAKRKYRALEQTESGEKGGEHGESEDLRDEVVEEVDGSGNGNTSLEDRLERRILKASEKEIRTSTDLRELDEPRELEDDFKKLSHNETQHVDR